MADQLCTTAQVKARLQGSGGAGVTFTAADDTLISELIDQISDNIEDHTHRKLVPVSSTTYVFDTLAGYVLRVPIGIRTITSMGVNNRTNQPDSGGSYTTVPATDYLLRPKTQDAGIGWPYTEVWISRGTLAGTIPYFGTIANGATITGTFGFAVTPPAVVGVAIEAVMAAWQNRKGPAGTIGMDSDPILAWGSYMSRNSADRMTLDRYRYIPV
jgi:hypothetical protein